MPAETGHAKNVENFATLIAIVEGFGAEYQPSNAALEVAEMQVQLAAAEASLVAVTDALMPHKTAVNERETAFASLRPLVTRVVNAYRATGADQNRIDDALTFARKIQGRRAKPKPKDDPNTPEDESERSHSASQQSYTQLVANLENLIAVLGQDSAYAPNETVLQLASLTNYATILKNANAAVSSTRPAVVNARIARDRTLYGDPGGVFYTQKLVKAYVKALYGAASPQYDAINGLHFTKPRKR
ncbi:MAG: hypothetical protein KF762_18965 [Acidobacteria bacterium]|nr:hypothetical protein [Acidobacteriota bacterium]